MSEPPKERMIGIRSANRSESTEMLLEETATRYEAETLIRRIEEHLRDVPELPPGIAATWLRSDRESH